MHYFKHFCCLLFKLPKAFSVSLLTFGREPTRLASYDTLLQTIKSCRIPVKNLVSSLNYPSGYANNALI